MKLLRLIFPFLLEKHLCFSQSDACEAPPPPSTEPDFSSLLNPLAGPRPAPVPTSRVPCLVMADRMFTHRDVDVLIDHSCSLGVFHFNDGDCSPRLRWSPSYLELEAKTALDTIFAEPNCMSDRIKKSIREGLLAGQEPYTILCDPTIDSRDECAHAYLGKSYKEMTLAPQEHCKSLPMALIIRHEMQHSLANDDHVNKEKRDGPRDRVLACDLACFQEVGVMTFSTPEDCL